MDFTFSDRLGILDRAPGAELGEAALAVLMPGGRFPRGGGNGKADRIDTRALARTLRLIARKGPAAIERHVRGEGGLLGRDDLAAYRTRTLHEPPLRYRGCDYVSCYDEVASADRYGNMASCCISIGSSFGSLVYVPEVGCFLNNAMQNFDPRPGRPNSIAPGKMPIFAAPALVAARRGRAVFAASGSGGYRIETGVLHTFMNRIDHGMRVQAAVDHPRVHCQGGETLIDPRVPEPVRERLRRAGHDLVERPESPGGWPYGRVCTVAWDPRRKCFEGGAGPSWQSAVAAF